MSADFVGCVVSLDCGVLGSYQGLVASVNTQEQSITVTNAFHNGIPCKVPHVTLSASDLQDLKILKTAAEFRAAKEIVDRKTPNAINDQNSPSIQRRGSKTYRTQTDYGNSSANYNQEEPYRKRTNSASEKYVRKPTTPRKEFQRRQGNKEDCFSASVDSFTGEFDFEKNLALFDKQAVFEEIENLGYPGIVRQSDKRPGKYGVDENVLQSGPAVYQQICVTGSSQEYVTDTGLVVPCVAYPTRNKLQEEAVRLGISSERQTEMVGRSAAEMVMQLLGGSIRLCPKNAHQRPSVVILSGPHSQGAQGANCARHLVCHNVQVTLFVPETAPLPEQLQREISLFELTEGKRVSRVEALANEPVDMIVSALDCHGASQIASANWYRWLVDWANQVRAPALAIDPPSEGSGISTKWSLGVCLPLALGPRCGQIYLCDLSLPKKVFKKLGITYQSPFAHKFVIPLHARTKSSQ